MSAKLELLNEELATAGYDDEAAGLSYVEQEHDTELPATFFPYNEGFVRVDWIGDKPVQAVLDAIQVIIDAHDPINKSSSEIAEENRKEAKARFLISQLADKTPEEIYTLMQTRMDSWTTLGDARTDLREWLPLMAAIIAWTVARE